MTAGRPLLVVALAASLALSACGRKGALEAPPDPAYGPPPAMEAGPLDPNAPPPAPPPQPPRRDSFFLDFLL